MAFVMERKDLGELFKALQAQGRRILGPVIREEGVVYADIQGPADLPEGVGTVHEAGRFRLRDRTDGAVFGFIPGQDSWKRHLYPPQERMLTTKREGKAIQIEAEPVPTEKLALIGVRACELAALDIHDRVLVAGRYPDAGYVARRENSLLVAVNCTEPGGTCFCGSMKTGPKVRHGFDLAMTEVVQTGKHWFLVEVGSVPGEKLLEAIPHRQATAEELKEVDQRMAQAEKSMGRFLNTSNLEEILPQAGEHPRWKDVASRCLTCGNCTMVCPTCFCQNVFDTQDLTGQNATREEVWDTCFNLEFSFIHGGSTRVTAKARYQQWLTHKLAYWKGQFGTLGCVGCGRCITWCPAGIDITEEAAALREPAGGKSV